MNPKRVSSVSTYLLMFAMLLLSACGGGGGSSTAVPDAPVLSLTLQSVKTFHFTWADVSDETEYRLLEDPDSVSGYTQIATISVDAQSHDLMVMLPKRINARYILQACNAGGCSDSAQINVSGTLIEAIGYVKASNTNAGDLFGYSVALAADGNTLAVGTYAEAGNATGIDGNSTNNLAIFSGAVYVYIRDGASWNQQAYIKASNSEAGDYFGYSVALAADGNTLAVGAYLEASKTAGIDGDQADNSASGSGAVYVFSRDGVNWSQQAYVKASNTQANDLFGTSVALAANGNTLAVGATDEDSIATGIEGSQSDNTAGASGAVYVFIRNGASWSQQAYVKASNTDASDEFGTSVTLAADGNTLAVGAQIEASNATGIDGAQSDNSASGSGAVYIFIRSGTTWTQQAYVKASNTEASDRFGYSVALAASGNTLAVGARLEDSNATGIDGNQGDNSADASGAVYVFTRNGAGWSQQAYVKASNTDATDFFGRSIALTADGNTLAVVAAREDSNATGINGDQTDNSAIDSGAVYLFTRDAAGAWLQQAYVKASNTEAGDQFGTSVALAADGNTLAVGAQLEDSSATGINGDQADAKTSAAGAAYLF